MQLCCSLFDSFSDQKKLAKVSNSLQTVLQNRGVMEIVDFAE